MLAFATVVTLAAVAIADQPVRSPWWTYADADATYTASGLNLMLGNEMTFVDHPGLPITEAVAVVTGVDALLEEGSLTTEARLRYVDRTLLNLDRARPIFRGIAILVYLAGAVLAFALAARLFGHWTWGLALGLLWLAAPGLIPMSIQLRPDVLLAVLCIVFAFAIARAIERRSVEWYAGAAALLGFATMVKLHALALIPALALAAYWRPPPDGALARTAVRTRESLAEHRRLVIALGGVWLVLVVLLNWDRFPFEPTGAQVRVPALLFAAVALVVVAAEVITRRRIRVLVRVLNRFHAVLAVSFVAGLLLPVTLDVQDGVRALVYIVRNTSGEGVQEGIEPFSTPLSAVEGLIGRQAAVLLALGLVAGVVGLIRRRPVPVVWAFASLCAFVFAFARPPNVHYFAPAFVFAAFALLWLVKSERRLRVPALAWIVVLYLLMPAWDGRKGTAAEQERLAELVRPATAYADANLRPGEVAIVPSYWPFADARYFELVEIYVAHSPQYPYRYLPATSAAGSYAQRTGVRPRFFIGPQATSLAGQQPVELGELGTFTLAPAEGLVARVVGGPGLTEPW